MTEVECPEHGRSPSMSIGIDGQPDVYVCFECYRDHLLEELPDIQQVYHDDENVTVLGEGQGPGLQPQTIQALVSVANIAMTAAQEELIPETIRTSIEPHLQIVANDPGVTLDER